MTLSRDVILDLLPVYLSGDASDATRALVDAWLQHDPALARQVEASRGLVIDRGPSVSVPGDLELHTLRRTRQRLTLLRWLFGVACFFSAISLGVEVTRDDGRLDTALLLVRYPTVMMYPALAAIGCWVAYYALRRRGRSGLT